MRETSKKFLNLFFNEGEQICFSANKYAYKSEPQENLNDECTVFVAINPIEGQREDANVTKYRTFMIELDDMSLDDQMKYVKRMDFPYSYCCFSGGKSLHFALVLDHDIPSDNIYRHTYQWILNIMEQADQKTKNPSRSIRFPGTIRMETGKEQKLVHMGDRISLQTLSRWLNKHPHKAPKVLVRKKGRSAKANIQGVKKWAKKALKDGVHNMDGSRNQTWMALGCEFALNGFDLDDTIFYLKGYFEEQHDFKEREWLTSIKSGWNYADKINQ